jgi:hypothetical protein
MKSEMERRAKARGISTSIIPETLKHPIFYEIMTEWEQWFKSHSGEDKYYPVMITVPAIKTSTPTKTPPKSPAKYGLDYLGQIPVQWNGKTIRFDTNPRKKNSLHNCKCLKCWQKGQPSCSDHSETKLGFLRICSDNNEQTINIFAIVQYEAAKKKDWMSILDSSLLNRNTLLQSYNTFHPQHNFQPIFDISVPYNQKNPVFHTIMVIYN